jgi:hypothetical protein
MSAAERRTADEAVAQYFGNRWTPLDASRSKIRCALASAAKPSLDTGLGLMLASVLAMASI